MLVESRTLGCESGTHSPSLEKVVGSGAVDSREELMSLCGDDTLELAEDDLGRGQVEVFWVKVAAMSRVGKSFEPGDAFL